MIELEKKKKDGAVVFEKNETNPSGGSAAAGGVGSPEKPIDWSTWASGQAHQQVWQAPFGGGMGLGNYSAAGYSILEITGDSMIYNR
jgi:hypothetical protein